MSLLTNEKMDTQIQSLKEMKKHLLDQYGKFQYRYNLIDENKFLVWLQKRLKS